jgi:carbonic anhydrase
MWSPFGYCLFLGVNGKCSARCRQVTCAGLLNGRPATTHWHWYNQLIQKHPLVKVDADPIFRFGTKASTRRRHCVLILPWLSWKRIWDLWSRFNSMNDGGIFAMHRRPVGVQRNACSVGLRKPAAHLTKIGPLELTTFVEDNVRINMKIFESMLERNKDFAAQQSAAGTLMPSLPRALPNVKAIIIGCADMRVDPAHVLGVKPGEAVVMRNIGGRITPGLLEQLGLLGRIGQVAGEIPGGGGEFHLILLQHSDCGITRLAGDPALLTNYFQIEEGELGAKSVADPRTAIAVDIAALRAVPALPANWLISGLVYDVATGLVNIVIPPAPIRTK